jgi:hypothetical protein
VAKKRTVTKLIEALGKAGVKAGLAHPKAKLWAKVNHEDNFALAIHSTVEDAMLDVIGTRIDHKDTVCIDWFNEEVNKEFNKLVLTTSREVYKLLT